MDISKIKIEDVIYNVKDETARKSIENKVDKNHYFTGTNSGLVPVSDGDSNKYLSADGEWKEPPYLSLKGGTLSGDLTINGTHTLSTYHAKTVDLHVDDLGYFGDRTDDSLGVEVGHEGNSVRALDGNGKEATLKLNPQGGDVETGGELVVDRGITGDIQTNITTHADLNDLTTGGFYYLASYTADPHANMPGGAVNGWLLVLPSSTVQVKQIFWRHGTIGTNDFQTFTRSKNSSGWGEWVRYGMEPYRAVFNSESNSARTITIKVPTSTSATGGMFLPYDNLIIRCAGAYGIILGMITTTGTSTITVSIATLSGTTQSYYINSSSCTASKSNDTMTIKIALTASCTSAQVEYTAGITTVS